MFQGFGRRMCVIGILVTIGMLFTESVFAQTISIQPLANMPTLDGKNNEWEGVSATTIPLKKTKPDGVVEVKNVVVKAGTYGERVYMFVEWDDSTQNEIHKPWIWDESLKKYKKGPQREDRLAIQFGISGDYTTDWASGNEFKADTWHWKASRSNPVGLAHDKSLIVSRTKVLRSYKLDLADGRSVYLSRPSDAGDKLYRTKRYRRFDQPMMLSYLVEESPKGSIADVSARGVWSDGKWRLELSRALVTGNDDDVEFQLTSETPLEVKGGFAVFDQSENDDHRISDTVIFRFLPWQARK